MATPRERSSQTPVLSAYACIARSSAAEPFDQPANAHLSAEAFEVTRASIGEPAKSAATVGGVVAGEIEARLGRATDDPAVDEAREPGADLARGRGRDRVRVDVDARVAGERLRRVERGVGRHDGEDDLGARCDVRGRARVGERRRASPRRIAPSLRRPEHLVTGRDERVSDRRAHLARLEETDDHGGESTRA